MVTLTVKAMYTNIFLLFFYIFAPGVIWTSVAADLLSALCWGSGVMPRPLFDWSLFIYLVNAFEFVCLFLLVR